MSNFTLSAGTEIRSSHRTYTIQRVLGQGGFGITYLVKTNLQMGKLSYAAPFALKEHFIQMLCERDASTNRVRFMQSATKEVKASKRAFISEAQRLQRLGINHPNIVNVDEVFEANGTAYYVMEYLDGGSVADYVKAHGGRLSWNETAKLMRPICEAVAMLHNNKVAHYDIKPQNIMIQQDEDGLRPVLIDFGLAKHYDGQGQATSTLAAGGYTPGYAPLEQLGGITTFSPTCDVYALAATICFCLTGHAPAKANELNLDALCDELLTVGVDAAIANVLLQAMELRATDRPADACVLTASLFNGASMATIRKPRTGGGGGGTPTQVKDRPATPPVTPATAPRRRWLVPVVAAVAVALAAIIFFATRGGDDTPGTESDTVRVEHPSKPNPAVAQQPNYRTEPRNLDLQVTLDGEKYYFSQGEWADLSSNERSRFSKCGVVIDYNGLSFVVKLTMERHGSGFVSENAVQFTWDEAKRWESNLGSGWRLPNKDEGRAMTDQCEAICAAIKAFGGDKDPADWYWTSTEYDASTSWKFYLCVSAVYRNTNSLRCSVRVVRAI